MVYRYGYFLGLLGLIAVLLMPAAPAAAQQGLAGLKIGVVNLQVALNKSSAGERSKNILLASKTQMENELKTKGDALKKDFDELRANIMLSEEARTRQEKEFRVREQALQKEARNLQRELQQKERKLTESIFIELKTVIDELGREEKFDLILEQNASQVILFTSKTFENITDRVIQRYNKFQGGK